MSCEHSLTGVIGMNLKYAYNVSGARSTDISKKMYML